MTALLEIVNVDVGPRSRTSGQFGGPISSGACGVFERRPRVLNRQHAFHGAFDGRESADASVVDNRPAFPKPVFRLFDGGDLLSVTAFGDDECQGFAPAYFYHQQDMGSPGADSKAEGFAGGARHG